MGTFRVGLQSLFCALSLIGCIPVPAPYQRLPNVEGAVTEHGKPLAGDEIALGRDLSHGRCGEVVSSTHTDQEGIFTLQGERGFFYTIPLLPADALVPWHLCFKSDKDVYLVWDDSSTGPNYTPRHIRISCDLSRTEHDMCARTQTTW